MNIRKHKYVIILVIFVLCIGAFAFIRATNDYRWSTWAIGDAQSLNSIIHFKQEGFLKHYFLTYFHPGYLGEKYGASFNLKGYYTHYPPLYTIILGAAAKIIGDNLYTLRVVSIVFSLITLILWYGIAVNLFNSKVALVSTIFIGISIPFLDFIDGINPYTYDEFYCYGAILFFLLGNRISCSNTRKILYLFLVWVFTFLQSFNSFDYIIYLQLFFLGYYILSRKAIRYKVLLFLATAPIAGFVLHFIQNCFAAGNVYTSYSDLWSIFHGRFITPFLSLSSSRGIIRNAIQSFDGDFYSGYGFSIERIFFLLIICLLLIQLFKKTSCLAKQLSANKILLLFGLCPFVYWFLMAQSAFSSYMVRHAFPFLGILFALTVIMFVEMAKTKDYSKYYRFLMILLLLFLVSLPLKKTLGYLKKYPNLLGTRYTWQLNTSRGELTEGIEISKKIRNNTSFGDIVLVPDQFLWHPPAEEPLPIFEYYSQRRMEKRGNSKEEYDRKMGQVRKYVQDGPVLFNEPNIAKIRVFVLIDKNKKIGFQKEIMPISENSEVKLNDKWSIYYIN